MSQPPNSSPSQALVDILPDSILSDIFLHAKSASPGWYQQIRAPFALATVSRRWHAIALSTSRLWDYMDALLPIERTMTHLTRSRHVPMRVWLDIFRAYTVDCATLTGIFHTLGTDIWNRARDLIVLLDYQCPSLSQLTLDTLNSMIGANHPVVFEKITVTVLIDSFDPDDAELSNALRLHLPNSQILRCLRLEQVAPSLNHLAHVSPLPLLQELDLK
ncbi:hypothetical protein FRC08_004427, partial [Ceratobasidium sp. 394]